MLAIAAAAGSPGLAQGMTTRASVASSGGEGDHESVFPAISSDGRFVAFSSGAGTLVPGDNNGWGDVFVRDAWLGLTTRVSVDSAGNEADSDSFGKLSISADGRFVAFASHATNLVPGDNNGWSDVFVHDRSTGATTRVNVSSLGVEADNESYAPALTPDGRYVVFESGADNLVPGDNNANGDVFVHDLQTGATSLVSVDSNGAAGDDISWSASISADGRFVAFESFATNLVAGDTNLARDVFVRDRQTGVTSRVSVDSSGAQTGGGFAATISSDGRYVAFVSTASDLVAGDTNGVEDVFVHDRQTGQTVRASVDSAGAQGDSMSVLPSISGDGRRVAFCSAATNLVPGDTNATCDVFVRDLVAQTTERVSTSTSGAQGDGDSGGAVWCVPVCGVLYYGAAISQDGRAVAFTSEATNLVAGDTNAMLDVFVHDRVGCSGESYCTAGTTSNGCTATISGVGTASATSSSGFTIQVTGVEGQKQGIVFYGISGRLAAPWGTGTSVLCVRHPTQRTGSHNSGGTIFQCDGSFALDWNAYVAAHPSALGAPFSVGSIVDAQAWFRDPPSPKSTSLSDALEFRVCP